MSSIGLSGSSSGLDTGFCIICLIKSSMDKYWCQWGLQGIGRMGLIGGSRTSGLGSGWVDIGQGVSGQGGRSSTKGGSIGSSCLLIRLGGIALGNKTVGWA